MGRRRRISVLLVDDHPSVLQGLRGYLKKKQHIKIVGQGTDGAEAIRKTRQLLPDVVLMDLSLPQMNGLEALRTIHCEIPRAKLIAYTMHESREFVRAAMRAGAAGYVLKSSSLAELVRGIEGVQRGQIYFDRKISRFLAESSLASRSGLKKAEPGGSMQTGSGNLTLALDACEEYNLTRREKEILGLMADGLTIKEIAEQLHISNYTAISHAKRIYAKLQVHSRGEAVGKALRGLLV